MTSRTSSRRKREQKEVEEVSKQQDAEEEYERQTPAMEEASTPGSAPARKSRQGVKLRRASLYCEELLSDGEEGAADVRGPAIHALASTGTKSTATPSSARRKLDLGEGGRKKSKTELAQQLF